MLKPLICDITRGSSVEKDWAQKFTVCHDGCGCHNLDESDTLFCQSASNQSSNLSFDLSDSSVSTVEEQPVAEHQSSKLYFSNIKLVREFYSDSQVQPLPRSESQNDEEFASNDHLESIGVF
jgi:hypothetical protein